MGDGPYGLIVSQARDQPAIDNLENGSFRLGCSVGTLLENAPHMAVALGGTVKKIAKDLPENKAVGRDSVDVETQREVTATQEDWRQLAQRVQQEMDPNKMIGLVEQLIITFDNEKARKSLPPTRNS